MDGPAQRHARQHRPEHPGASGRCSRSARRSSPAGRRRCTSPPRRCPSRARPRTCSPTRPPATRRARSSSARTWTPSSQGPGINDNGSGTAGILEIAEQFAARDIEPRNQVRFAWWGAEEFNLLGSTYYVEQPVGGRARRRSAEPELRHDRLAELRPLRLRRRQLGVPGRPRRRRGPGWLGPDRGRVHALLRQPGAGLGADAVQRPLGLRAVHRRGRIPAGGLFTGAEGIKTAAQAAVYGGTAGQAYDPCYHQACDTFANNSDDGLSEMSDAAAHAVYTFAKTKAEITNDGALKPGRNGSRARPAAAPARTAAAVRPRGGGRRVGSAQSIEEGEARSSPDTDVRHAGQNAVRMTGGATCSGGARGAAPWSARAPSPSIRGRGGAVPGRAASASRRGPPRGGSCARRG